MNSQSKMATQWIWRFWRFGWKKYRLQKSQSIEMKAIGYDVWKHLFWKFWWKTKTLSHNGRFWNGIKNEYSELREIDQLQNGYFDIFNEYHKSFSPKIM